MKKTLQDVLSVLVGGICEAEMTTKWKVFFSFPKKCVSISLWKRIQLAFKKVLARICIPLAQFGKTKWAQIPDTPLMFQTEFGRWSSIPVPCSSAIKIEHEGLREEKRAGYLVGYAKMYRCS